MTTITWGESVARHLVDGRACPICSWQGLDAGCCPRCGADLRGPIGVQVWQASTAAAAALRAREAVLAQVPFGLAGAAAGPAAPVAATAPVAPAAAAERTEGRSATLQSVLAIAGAGLFAIAAIVFTFLNPDLSDRVLRSVIVALVTVVFLGGSWLLARRGLQFSAEAVGALGLVFVGLDVYAIAQLGDAPAAEWIIAAAATAVSGGVLLAAASAAGIRTWEWGALLAVSVVPVMLGHSTGDAYAGAVGHIAAAAVAATLLEVRPDAGRRTLLVFQVITVLSAAPFALTGAFSGHDLTAGMLRLALILVLVAAHAVFATRHLARHWWSVVAGLAATGAVVTAACAPIAERAGAWFPLVAPAAAAGAFALLATAPQPRSVVRRALAAGSFAVAACAALLPAAFSVSIGMAVLGDFASGVTDTRTESDQGIWALQLGTLGVACGLWLFGMLVRRRSAADAAADAAASSHAGDLRPFAVITDVFAVVFAAMFVLTLAAAPMLPMPARIGTALAAAGAAALGLRAVRPLREAPGAHRLVVLIGIHLSVVVAVLLSWRDATTAPLWGIGVVAAIALAGAAVPAGIRFVHVGVGFAYALVCIGQALSLTVLGPIAVLCLVTSAALIGAIAATFLPVVGVREWWAVLAVTIVPFGAGILQVVVERSGWTALSTALMFVLALSLLLTRRAGLGAPLRSLAAAMLVPALAVVIICLGAQLLAVSGSPVTLPIIAVVVAAVLPSTTMIRDLQRRRGIGARTARASAIAIDASTLLTGAIAVGLALGREAAGLGTAGIVLLVIGLGAAVAGLTGRRFAWWVAGAGFTGALWCVWGLAGIGLVEAYVLPPAVGAALIGLVLCARGARAHGLLAVGAVVAILPTLALSATAPAGAVSAAWRAGALLAAAAALLVLGAAVDAIGRRHGIARLRAAAPIVLAAAGLAAVSGPILGMRAGAGLTAAGLHGAVLFALCLGVSAAASAVLAVAAAGVRRHPHAPVEVRRSRLLLAPAAIALAAGTWNAIERDWASIWLMWALMIGMLVLTLAAAAARGRLLPPVWLLFALSFITAVVAWSPRDLRVEWFSLPLGAFLLLAGVVGMAAAPRAVRTTLQDWPRGVRGSWMLLAPGLVTMLSASIVATFTDPLTWRAILVMVLALAAILVGASRRLAAPFLIGMIVLPIENVFVFSVQIGRGIESMPWWITLAVIGAVLLIIAVTYERRTGEGGTVVARVRDLR